MGSVPKPLKLWLSSSIVALVVAAGSAPEALPLKAIVATGVTVVIR